MNKHTWRDHALCNTRPAHMYESRNLPTSPRAKAAAAEAACAGCPATIGCGRAALEHTPIGMVAAGIAFPEEAKGNVTHASRRVALKLGIPMPTARKAETGTAA